MNSRICQRLLTKRIQRVQFHTSKHIERLSKCTKTSSSTSIEGQLSKLKVSELNVILRKCGIVQGVGKAHKVETLAKFIKEAQRLAFQRYFVNRSRKPKKIETIHSEFVPSEVVSIDIGFRNLAFAHISRTGEVLEWRRSELLSEAVFEPWVLADIVSTFVKERLPARPSSSCTYIIEHQRFRSQGSSSVTNSVMVNNLIEALLYSCLRNAGAHVEPINPYFVSMHWDLVGSGEDSESINLDGSTFKGAILSELKEMDDPETNTKKCTTSAKRKAAPDKRLRSISTLIKCIDSVVEKRKELTNSQQMLLMQALGESSRKRSVRSSSKEIEELVQYSEKRLLLSRDLRRRTMKKEQTIAVVQGWLIESILHSSSLQGYSVDAHLEQEMRNILTQSHELTKHVSALQPSIRFPINSVRMFVAEKKKDDLCDCVIQGAAWLEWQNHVVDLLNKYSDPQSLKEANAIDYRD